MIIIKIASSVEPDEMAHYLDLRCLYRYTGIQG